MLNVQTPGAYYERVDASHAPIRGVRTDVAGFVGLATCGPLDTPIPVESFRQFQSWFGDFSGIGYLAYAVRAFFENSGQRCWVVRVASQDGPVAACASSVVLTDRSGRRFWRIQAGSPGIWGNELSVTVQSEYREQTVTDAALNPPNYVTVATVTGFRRGSLVALSQPGATVMRVVSHLDPHKNRLYWVHPEPGAGLAYDRRLTGIDPDQPIVVTQLTYGIVVRRAGRVAAHFTGLSLVPEHANYGPAVLGAPKHAPAHAPGAKPNAVPPPIVIEALVQTSGTIPGPLDIVEGQSLPLTGGADGLAGLRVRDFVGEPFDPRDSDPIKARKMRGVRTLDFVHEIAVVAIPDILIQPAPEPRYQPLERPQPDPCITCPPPPEPRAPAYQPVLPYECPPIFSDEAIFQVQAALVQLCEEHRDRIALIDPPFAAARNDALGLGAVRAWRARFDSRYAALYYPWVQVVEPRGTAPVRAVPACGHVAGQYALNDLAVGVHKSPANRVLGWVQDVTARLSDAEHGLCNAIGINVIRAEPGRGIRILGARTLSSDPDWRYVSVRRLLAMVMKAVDLSTQWAVFEPNDHRTRTKIGLALNSFLTALWQRGALAGDAPEEAFFVKCDQENNPPDRRAAGWLLATVGVAPAIPFEFVVLRVGRQGNALEIEETDRPMRAP
ncbi:MAG: phage tail sheath family protein [bacterium]|nr:phage tail sheath family protein [bacterium]